ncbi:MAG: hypothetical protein M3434_09000, partial [Gemmatimonadota bacterium]|nr:hypothetical protein [Gemmatimonadota bacterium]
LAIGVCKSAPRITSAPGASVESSPKVSQSEGEKLPGQAIEEARAFGIEIALIEEALRRSPMERV